MATSHINTFSQVLDELSSQCLNFEEEIKALALLSSLLASWKVFYMKFTNSSEKQTMDETIRMILSEDIQRRSMELSIDDSLEAHFSLETAKSAGRSQS